MANIPDDIYLGNFLATQGMCLFSTGGANPTMQIGVGPMGRTAFHNFVPLTKQAASIAALQVQTAATPLTLAAGIGVTTGQAPDGSGATVYVFDTPRAVSLTSAANLSAGTFTVTGYDKYGRKQTQALAGPNINTVNTTKAFASVLSVVSSATSASTVSVGAADIFGLPFAMTDAGYLVSVKWNNALAQDAGTFVKADATSPATSATGDTRGTYAPSSASDGTKRLVIGMHLNDGQCGAQPTITNLLGVTPA